jgi:hypothetical protein
MKHASILVSLGFWLLIVSCAEKSVSNPESIQHIETELGGCNIAETIQRNDVLQAKNDTIVVSVLGESVRVFVQLNYTCKDTPFDTRYEKKDGTMYMYLIDTCTDTSDCYWRCTCCYTFDFSFKVQNTLDQRYQVVLIDPRQEKPVIFSEGAM